MELEKEVWIHIVFECACREKGAMLDLQSSFGRAIGSGRYFTVGLCFGSGYHNLGGISVC